MSEFTCSQGHLIKPSAGRCDICGGRAVRMDGFSASEWAAMEEADRKLEMWRESQEYKAETNGEENDE